MFARVSAALFAALLSASPALAQGPTAILIPGAGGPVPGDFLMRNIASFQAAGIQTQVATSAGQAAAAARAIARTGGRAVIVGMSRGAPTAAAAAASGAPVAGVVLVSGVYRDAMRALGSPAALPQALVVHHRRDQCPLTTPAAAQAFVAWTGGRASLAWIDTQGQPDGRPCGPFGAHGFFRNDAPAIGAIIGFIRSVQ